MRPVPLHPQKVSAVDALGSADGDDFVGLPTTSDPPTLALFEPIPLA